jgi:histidinol phosphatase-like enzyme (inositol monophosphatase family)
MTAIPDLRELLDFALEAAWTAGRVTLGYFQTRLDVERKGDDSPVTAADRAAEQTLRDLIGRRWPDHGIIGEEYGRQPGASGLTWVIDPIDGTKSFICGVPLYSCLLALTDGTRPLVGVAHFPALGETIYAARGMGCFHNGRRAHVSAVSDLGEAVLLASEIGGYAKHGKADAWEQLVARTRIQRTWGDAYGYLLVATGRAEIMLDAVMNIWDCAPLGVILEEAGGTFTDWQGRPTIDAGESIATNGALFEQVMALTRQRDA